ncbi:MAG: hypothetical protein Q9162_007954, partial [Coniocarpon cinnabarinum]
PEYGPHRGSQDKQMPFPELKIIHELKSGEPNGKKVTPHIEAQMDKNLMWVDGQWTCYRRNYITIAVHYTLDPNIEHQYLYIDPEDGRGSRLVQALGVRLAATMDEERGKHIGLIQHTAKRDRGPQKDVEIAKLPPVHPSSPMPPYHSTCATNGPVLPLQNDNDPQNTQIGPQALHTFERIQFKQATANNGRRRAQQQFYHIMVELHADIRASEQEEEKWVKIAHTMSDAMVVRGRSPGHYKDSPNASSQSHGGSAGGAGGSSFSYGGFGHGSVRYGGAMHPQGRGSLGGGGGAYRAHPSMLANPISPLATPNLGYAPHMRKFPDPMASTPLVLSSGSYTPLNTDESHRSFLYSPTSIYEPTNNLSLNSHGSVKNESIHSLNNPLITGSCGTEEQPVAQIYNSPWTMTTCHRVPMGRRNSFSDYGATTTY